MKMTKTYAGDEIRKLSEFLSDLKKIGEQGLFIDADKWYVGVPLDIRPRVTFSISVTYDSEMIERTRKQLRNLVHEHVEQAEHLKSVADLFHGCTQTNIDYELGETNKKIDRNRQYLQEIDDWMKSETVEYDK